MKFCPSLAATALLLPSAGVQATSLCRRVDESGRTQIAVVVPEKYDPEALVDLAITGAGVLQVALHHVVAALRAGRLKLLLGQLHDADEREIVLHYPHRQFLSPRVRVVVEALLARFACATDLHLRPSDVPAG